VTPTRGAHVLAAVTAAGSKNLRSDVKYIAFGGELIPSPVGSFPRPSADVARMLRLCKSWMAVWRAHAKAAPAAPAVPAAAASGAPAASPTPSSS